MFHLEFSGMVCILFNFQCSAYLSQWQLIYYTVLWAACQVLFKTFLKFLFSFEALLSSDSSLSISHWVSFVKHFFKKFWSFFQSLLNGEGGIWTLAPLLTTYSLSRGAPSTSWVLLQKSWKTILPSVLSPEAQRRGWDSNPRALADKRFSRPPRYDHFDTSPLVSSCCLSADASVILSKLFFRVNNFFQIFYKIFYFMISGSKNISLMYIYLQWNFTFQPAFFLYFKGLSVR